MDAEQPWDDARLKSDRLTRVQGEMKRRNVGALYLTDTVDIRYLFNVKIPGGSAFVPAAGDVIAFVRPRDAGYMRKLHGQILEPFYSHSTSWGPPGAPDGDPRKLAEGLRELMGDHGVGGETLGVDELDLDSVVALMQADFDLTYARPIIEFARAVKTEDEITIYRHLGQQYAHVFQSFRDALKPGVTEKELVPVVADAWQAAGGEKVAQLNVCGGENMNPWLRWPTERALKDGELVGIDFHGHGYNGLRGDASRTFLVGDGRPTGQQQDIYRRAYEYLKETAEVFRAGRSYAAAMAAVPPVPEKYEAQLQRYDIAHSIGMVPLGYPEVSPMRPPLDDTLQPNQVLSIECYFGEEGSALAVKLEEMVIVRDGAPEVIGRDVPFDDRFVQPEPPAGSPPEM